ncbi:Laminin subunit alpha-2 [Pseudolycoriella hygida]|uniref:Laminin subunit alpha-2 n=1 Tax=Pseudolycoriella hygida TaxID=35572 RepID=A0A9Q0NG47_9DIPT|nr:Laminin subunit alpha-2 [Pseudolycoriella hygida]
MEVDHKITTSLSHILLPTCNASEDVFLNVLKSSFSRYKYEKNSLDHAFKMGMSGNVSLIEEEDLTRNWKKMNSKEQQDRQATLLGFWAVENFPSMGKQLHGPSWHAKVNSLQANSKQIRAVEINAVIFKKLKLRVLKLNVSDSTLGKLKYFVRVPESIAKGNESKISRKIKAYDVDEQWLDHCWKALKLGGFSLAFEPQRDLIGTLNLLTSLPNNREEMIDDNGTPSIQAPKRARATTTTTNYYEPAVFDDGASISKDIHTDFQSVMVPKINGAGYDDSRSLRVNNALSMGYQADILSIRNDMSRLTEMLQSTLVATGQERLHIKVINQKDEVIAQLKATVQELRQENDGFIKDLLKSKEQIEKQAALALVLQNGSEAHLKLHEQSERSLERQIAEAATTKQKMDEELKAANRMIEKLREINTTGLVIELKAQIETLDKKLSANVQETSESIEKNEKLQKELDALKSYTVSKEEELKHLKKALEDSATTTQSMGDELNTVNQKKDKLQVIMKKLKEENASFMIALRAQIETSDANLAAAERVNSESIEANEKIQAELDAFKTYTDDKEQDLKNVYKALDDLEEAKRKIEDELNVTKQAKENSRDEVKKLKERSTSLVFELRAQIDTLNANLTAADQVNSESKEKNVKLQAEFDELKNYTVSKDEELENAYKLLHDSEERKRKIEDELNVTNQAKEKSRDEVKTLKERSTSLAIELKAQIDTLDANLTAAGQVNSESNEKNVKLQAELDELKNYAVSKVEELTNLQKSFSELQKQIDSMEKRKKTDVGSPTASICNESESVIEWLKELQFAWIKYTSHKNTKFVPGFIYPIDADGYQRAARVTENGHVSNEKHRFFEFAENVPDNLKSKNGVLLLEKFNKKFNFSFV